MSLFVVFLWATLAAWAAAPLLIGWKPVAVTSGSMGPTIGRGDVVVVAPHDGSPLAEGSIITFESEAGLVTHRILEVDADGSYRTKGDVNTTADSDPVAPGAVVGVGRILVPAVGWPVVWASEANWLLLSVWLLVMAFAFWWARWGFLRPIPLLGRHGAIQPWSLQQNLPRSRRVGSRTTAATAVLLSVLIAVPALALFTSSTTSGANEFVAAPSFTEKTFYLHNDPSPPVGDTTSHPILPMDLSSPSGGTLYNYDTDRDADPGLIVDALGTRSGPKIDPITEQNWDFSISSPTILTGTTTFTFWGAAPGFVTNSKGQVAASIYLCDDPVTTCGLMATNSFTASPFAPTGAWTQYTIDFGSLWYNAPANSILRLEVVTADSYSNGLMLAYDTTAYPSRLHFSG